MNVGQAALLLRCQAVRTARAQAEVARAEAKVVAIKAEADTATATCSDHAAEATAFLRAGYDGLAGRAASMGDIQDLRQAEMRHAARQADLRREIAVAEEHLQQAVDAAVQARRNAMQAARQKARREQVHERALHDTSRAEACRDAVRAEDEHALQTAWRP